jgi:hypothetical protein
MDHFYRQTFFGMNRHQPGGRDAFFCRGTGFAAASGQNHTTALSH